MELAREVDVFNDEVLSMKKKIQLSEGQRKAEYEEFHAEKKKLTSQIRALKKEIKEATAAKPTQLVDLEVLRESGRPMKELMAFQDKTPEEVLQILDLQCIDLQKKIDLARYDIQRKKERYAASLREMKQMAEEHDTETIIPLHGSERQMTKLENKIHETGLHLLEMRHLERKYSKMRQTLLDDRVFFQSTLDKYEEEIAKQAKEINHLQSVRDEAVRLRDKTRRKLARLEAQVVAQGVERERQLQELKRKVEEGRAYLEKVERSLVPPNKIPQQDSGEADENGVSSEQQAKEALQAKLQKLKDVTGAKDEEDILVKLKNQKMTKERLLKLKNSVENEKKKLEMQKEQLEAELEAVKFSQVKEKEQNEEDLELHDRALRRAKEEIEEARPKYTKEKVRLTELRDQVKDLCEILMAGRGKKSEVPDSDDEVFAEEEALKTQEMEELVKSTKEAFNEMITTFQKLKLHNTVPEPLSSLYEETGLMEETRGSRAKEGGADKEGEKASEEAADVPSRDFLKRQSQLMVEAQGKRKGYPKEGGSSYK